MLDATRAVENAYFIKQREAGYSGRSVAEILHEFCALSDGCTMSGKKDAAGQHRRLARAQRRRALRRRPATWSSSTRACTPTAAWPVATWRRWPAASRNRSRTTTSAPASARSSTSAKPLDAGVPIVLPIGGHAVFLDAKRFYPHIPQDQFPAQTLAAELYLDSGIRAMERGIVSAGRDTKTGDHHYPKLELVRLTIPRRVYTQAHMDVTAESVAERVRAARPGARPAHGVRAEVPALLPGALRATVRTAMGAPPPGCAPGQTRGTRPVSVAACGRQARYSGSF